MRVLIVEDEVRLGRLIAKSLAEHKYAASLVGTCAEASDAIVSSHYDAVVLDLNLPDGDGLSLVSDWRESGLNEPVLILSARDGLDDRVKGLNVGADDYLPKPFSFDELLARLRAIARRQAVSKQTFLKHGSIELDLLGHAVEVAGQPLDLTRREYALLEVFMQNAGRVLTRSMICERIWSSDREIDTNLLDVYMSRLRHKMEAMAGKPLFRTVRGTGYRLL